MRRVTASKGKRRETGRLSGLVARLSPRALFGGRPAKAAAGRKRGQKKRVVRRRRHAVLNRRNLRLAAIGLTPLLLIAGLVWLWQDGWFGRQAERSVAWAYGTSADAGLRVADLLVEGRQRSKRSAIVESLGIERGMPILAIDLKAAQARLQNLPWVRRSIVERRLPDEIYVRLEGRAPMALWQVDGEIFLIDEGGKVVPGVDTGAYAQLPLVVGPGAPARAGELIAMLDGEAALRGKVTAAVWVSGRRWNIELQGGISVRLPEGDMAAAWVQLAEVERREGLLSRDVVVVDLRLPDRLVVRTAPGAELVDHDGENT